jgi:hypothetical protein
MRREVKRWTDEAASTSVDDIRFTSFGRVTFPKSLVFRMDDCITGVYTGDKRQ